MLKEARTHKPHKVAVVGMLLMWALPMAAQALTYRCELPPDQPGGQPEVRYQSQACEGGRALHNTDDHRTDAQRSDTTKSAKADAKLARQLERERRRHEKLGAGKRPIAMDDGPLPAKPAASSSTQGQTLKRARPFTARAPKTTPANKQKPSN
jgi:hypothetical protein